MKHIGKFVTYLIQAVNVFFIGILLLTAYSPYLHPATHPVASCMGLTFPIFLVINTCFLIFWLIANYKLVVIPLVGFILCFPQIQTYLPMNFHTNKLPEGCIKILSYNVMSFGNLKKEMGKNPILEYIRECNADIVCLQEYNAPAKAKQHLNAQEIRKALSMYPYHHIQKVGDKKGNNQIAIYSRYPILSARELDYDSMYNGSAIYELKINKDTVTVINNHLESNKLTKEDKVVYEAMLKDPDADKVKSGTRQLVNKLAEASAIRSRQADVIAQAIKDSRNRSIIVCGDFNDTPISYTHHVISQNLKDAFTKSGRGLGVSYNQNKFYFRIDNIIVSRNLDSYNCTVDHSIKDSDHYPIWSYVKINP